MKRTPIAIAIAALASFIPAQVQAQSAVACLTEREVAQMAIYAVPSLVDGVRGKCAARLSPNGFLATRGDAFAAKYAALRGETWPVAKSAILKFVSGSVKTRDADTMAMVAALPDESVRPLVDGMIAQKIGESVKPDDCRNVERGMQLVSVMNPRDSGAVVAFVMAMAKPKSPAICPATS